MTIQTRCPHCEEEHTVRCTEEGYEAWQKGALIENAMPELSAADREMLITGYCGRCWDKLFSTEE